MAVSAMAKLKDLCELSRSGLSSSLPYCSCCSGYYSMSHFYDSTESTDLHSPLQYCICFRASLHIPLFTVFLLYRIVLTYCIYYPTPPAHPITGMFSSHNSSFFFHTGFKFWGTYKFWCPPPKSLVPPFRLTLPHISSEF